jgi:polar amino acid transport system substrate-binding protein
MRILITLLVACLLALSARAGEREVLTVPLVTYYDQAPFYSPQSATDLTRQLADLLTSRSGGRYRFVATVLPKKRVENMAQFDDWQGLVAWLHPRFVNDEEQHRFFWTEPLLLEEDLVISRAEAPVEYAGPASLRGKVLGTVLNHRYADVEDMFARHELRRSDAASLETNVRKLLLGRVDVVFVSYSSLPGLRERIPKLDRMLYIAPQPRNHFTRHILLTRGLPPELVRFVQETVAKFGHDPEWQAIVARDHLESLTPKH